MTAKFVLLKVGGALATLAFVVVFNFFLFRVVAGDPVASLFKGRNLTPTQREELRHQFGLDGTKLDQFWSYVQQTAQLTAAALHEARQATFGANLRKIGEELGDEFGGKWASAVPLIDEALTEDPSYVTSEQSYDEVKDRLRTLFYAADRKHELDPTPAEERRAWDRIKSAPGARSYTDLRG